MPQSALPDVNTIIITYRRVVIIALQNKNYTSAMGSLGGMNACLPEDYRIDVNTNRYKELTQTHVLVKCKSCGKETKRTDLRILNIATDFLESILTGSSKIKRWKCKHCFYDNILSSSKMIKEKGKNPTFLKCVPDPPERQNGLSDRNSYASDMEGWIWKTLAEIDASAAKYRTDNWNKEQEDPDEDNIESTEDLDK